MIFLQFPPAAASVPAVRAGPRSRRCAGEKGKEGGTRRRRRRRGAPGWRPRLSSFTGRLCAQGEPSAHLAPAAAGGPPRPRPPPELLRAHPRSAARSAGRGRTDGRTGGHTDTLALRCCRRPSAQARTPQGRGGGSARASPCPFPPRRFSLSR